MNINKYTLILSISLILLAVGYGVGRYLQPARIEIKKEQVEVVKKDIKIVEKLITRPDGTTEKETITEDKTKTEKETLESSLTINKKPDWKVSGLSGLDLSSKSQFYGVQVDRRIIGPVFVGVTATTNKTIGLSVGMEF